MSSKPRWTFILPLSVLCLAVIFWLVPWSAFETLSARFEKKSLPLHIFINETEDHRSDDSIRVSILAAYQRTGVQNAVVITNSPPVGTMEEFGSRIFKELRVGERSQGRGILYYLNPSLRLLRIEVGYALEGVVPDALVKRLELAAKNHSYTDRFHDFWAELINTINIEIKLKQAGGESPALQSSEWSEFEFLSGGGGVSSSQYGESLATLLESIQQQKFKTISSSNLSPNETLQEYLRSLEQGVGSSELDFLTEDSRLRRTVYPQSRYQLIRNHRMYQKSGLDRVVGSFDIALAFFKESYPVLPIVLVKEDGRHWRISEGLSWSLFHRFEDSMKVFLKFPLQSKDPEIQRYLANRFPRPLYPLANFISLENLAATRVTEELNYSFFRLYWLERVKTIIDRSAEHEDSLLFTWMAADSFLNLGFMQQFVSFYEKAARQRPHDQYLQEGAKFYRKMITFVDSDWVTSRNSKP